jgi:hypothetical protein
MFPPERGCKLLDAALVRTGATPAAGAYGLAIGSWVILLLKIRLAALAGAAAVFGAYWKEREVTDKPENAAAGRSSTRRC